MVAVLGDAHGAFGVVYDFSIVLTSFLAQINDSNLNQSLLPSKSRTFTSRWTMGSWQNGGWKNWRVKFKPNQVQAFSFLALQWETDVSS